MTMPTFTDGVLAHATSLTSLSTGVNAVNTLVTGANAPRNYVPTATASINSLHSIANATDTIVSWDTSGLNNDAIWSAGSPSVFTIQTAGVYWVWAQCHFSAAAGGIRDAFILLNGTSVSTNAIAAAFRNPVNFGDGSFLTVIAPPQQLAVNAVLRLSVFQSSGGSLNLDNSDSGAFMSVVRIGS